jgi:D-beta-D-heptose 7-phosphate kinase/D-beta-D-heptose 1-phosphate adenosyltransferase
MPSDKRQRKAVVVVGDVMIDRYVTGKVERISLEAPVPVLLHSHDHAVAGGVANVAVNIVALGCGVGAVGSDQNAEDLRQIRVALFPLLDGHSSTGIVERMRL